MTDYRFDNSTQQIHKFSEKHGAYIFVGSYMQNGIDADMSDSEKISEFEEREYLRSLHDYV